jgi:hypothetical protein
VSEQEPHPFRQDRLLGKQAFDQTDEGARAIVHSQYRRGILAAKGIIRAIFNGTCEKSAVHVKQGF